MEAEDHAERVESVHRMDNLYPWARKCSGSCSQSMSGQMMGEEAFYVTSKVGRDLCS